MPSVLCREGGADSAVVADKDELKRQADELKSKMAGANSDDMATLQQQLRDTNDRLKRVEQQGLSGTELFSATSRVRLPSPRSCRIQRQNSGERLRYAGLNPHGDPLQDSDGNPILTLDGNGPEVKFDVFGTGFLAGPDGRVITNRHVAEPWWKNDEWTR